MAFSFYQEERKDSDPPPVPPKDDYRDVERGHDLEGGSGAVRELSWSDVNVTVRDGSTKQDKHLLQGIVGDVRAGEILALMGPSGSGKTTLLNLLARRSMHSAGTSGDVLVDGRDLPRSSFQAMTSFVEQEDALIGALTVRETLSFSLRLSGAAKGLSKAERERNVDDMLSAFGLKDDASKIIGTPIKKGVSGGQKRRTSVAAELITQPRILFLDEPTSGLDSAASYEVVSYLREYARKHRILVVASIHQPSTTTFNLFDKLLLLSQGRTCFFGPLNELRSHFDGIGHPIPNNINPAEHILDLVNVDFGGTAEKQKSLSDIHSAWSKRIPASRPNSRYNASDEHVQITTPSIFSRSLTLLHLNILKSYRDVIAYGVRLAMYLGLAIMMGTVWLRLPEKQSSIQPLTNAIFFGSAFMSFMAVAYVPSFLEDRSHFRKDRLNGLVSPLPFSVANFIVGIPYLFLFSVVFSVVAYWLTNLRPSGTAFMTWIMWVFLDLLAAESLVVLISSLLPNFVIALAVTAFANGLWMSVGGFLVSPTILNPFWKYVFHYIDYQAYVFQGMMVNEFAERTFSCGEGCRCMYDSALAKQCRVDGRAVLEIYGYRTGRTGKWVGISIAIVVVYRILAYLALRFRR